MLATLRQRDFALLWVAGLVSLTGDWVLTAALPVYVYQRTNSILASGLIWLVYMFTGLLGSVVGVFVDRWDRRRTMVAVSLLQAALMPGLLLAQRDDLLWVVYAVTLVESTLYQFFSHAENALLPRLVGEDRLVRANALNSLNDSLARIAGPAIGGLLLASAGLAGAALVDAASYLVAALLIALIASPGDPPMGPRAAEGGAGAAAGRGRVRRVWREWTDGLRLIRTDQQLRRLLLVGGAAELANGLSSPLMLPLVMGVAADGAAAFGTVLAVRGVAGLLGGILIAWFGHRVAPPRLLGWSLLGVGTGFWVMISVPSLVTIFAVQLAIAPAIAGWLTSQRALLQSAGQDHYRGRVLGSAGTIASLMALIGIGLSSALGDVAGLVPLYNISALLYAAAGILALTVLRSVARPHAL